MAGKKSQIAPGDDDSSKIDMRLMGVESDLEKWSWFLDLLESKDIITVLQKGRLYRNRGDSKLYRLYVKIKLNR